ncbi:MAG: hypothetical protein M3440_15160 [Chloroflexota bacterium]|nr:hypothetical protein [Chloroflexota bacterium]
MTNTSLETHFSGALFEFLEETFETHHGFYLDKGTSLFETLSTVSATEASRPVSASCASVAAQVNHVTYYLDVLRSDIAGKEFGEVDWSLAWRIGPVSDEEWTDLVQKLRDGISETRTVLKSANWDSEDHVYGAIAILVHTAYHLGEIRQALCTISNARREQ